MQFIGGAEWSRQTATSWRQCVIKRNVVCSTDSVVCVTCRRRCQATSRSSSSSSSSSRGQLVGHVRSTTRQHCSIRLCVIVLDCRAAACLLCDARRIHNIDLLLDGLLNILTWLMNGDRPSRRMCRVNLNSLNYSFALLHQKVISKLPRQQHQRIIAVSHIIYHCDPESCSLVRRWSKRSRSIEICTTKDLEVHWVIEATDQCYFCCAMLSFFITLDGSTKTKTHSCTKWKIYTSTEEKIKEKQ